MTTPFVNPNARGLVVDRVGQNTAYIGNKPNVQFMQGIARGMLNTSHGTQGMFSSDVDEREALNLDKNAVRRVIVVASHNGDALNKSPASMAANINFATSSNDNLFDEVTQINIRPASNVYNNGITPKSSETLSVVRKYDTETKGTEVVLSSTIVKKLKEIENNLYNETPMLVGRPIVPSQVLDQKRLSEAKDIAATLKQIIGTKVTMNKMALMLGLGQSTLDAIRRNAVDAALLQTSEEFADSLIQAGFRGDVVQRLRETHTFDNFCNAYCKRIVSNMFMLAKRPQDTVAWLNEVSDLFSRNLTTDKTFVDDMQVTSAGQGTLPVEKILLVGEQTVKQIPGVESAQRVGLMPLGYYDNSKFYVDSNRSFIKLNESGNQVEQGDSSNFTDLLDLVKQNNRNMDGTISYLTPLAERIFDLSQELNEEDIAAQESTKLYDAPVNDRCQILPGKKGAIVINVDNMNRLGPYGNEEPDTSRSSKPITNIMMKASMGDQDLSDTELYGWPELVMSDKAFQSNALQRFGVNDIFTKTETISPKAVRFTNHHMAMAFADPALWDFDNEALKNINMFMTKRMENVSMGFRDFNTFYQKVVERFRKKDQLTIDFYNFGSKEAGSSLTTLEYAPFYNVTATIDGGKPNLKSAPRTHIGSMPGWLVDPKFHIAFGNMLCKDKNSMTALAGALRLVTPEQLKKGIADGDENVNKAAEPVKNLLKILKEIMSAAFSKVADVKTVASVTDKLLMAYVIAPVVIADGNYSVDVTSELKPVAEAGDARFDWTTADATLLQRVHLANIVSIAGETGFTPMTKILTLLGMMRRITPRAMIQNALSRYPTGLSLDILKLERLYNNDMLMATPKAVDVIITPQPVEVSNRGNGDRAYMMTTKIQSVNNMAGGSAIALPNAIPSVRIDHTSTDFDSNPIICMDHVTTSSWSIRGVSAWIDNVESTHAAVTAEDAAIMKNILKEAETARRLVMNSSRSRPGKTDSYTLMLRPTSHLQKNVELYPYMGVPRYCCLSGEYSKIAMVNFYSRSETTNPWISTLGSVYNQWYTNSAQIIAGASGNQRDGVIGFQTVTINPSAGNLSETTLLLTNAFDFATFEESNLDALQEHVVEDHLNYKGGMSNHSSREVAITRSNPPSEDNYLSHGHQLTRMGMTVPCTAYTNETIKRETRKEGVPFKHSDIGFCVISPVSL
ncbi:hypothetical protein AbHV_ORF68 [Abalone herpesvirus Victoria/AUS/2009]|uniref:Major capsid protein n=1 Tax=Abalone herpesvirus (isolate Abalone/Australia/Victoria/2009) TaxID=1241371 RepID=K4JX70_ABHV|nr:hypothetical protein AbHV_ORF68 [Abalone herpesvirus Victoria/AUS/2009]AFU90080.1 hypothetical protein AbHV_ORF68 [Abalone herpesvirus Victoria/AUS/2009]